VLQLDFAASDRRFSQWETIASVSVALDRGRNEQTVNVFAGDFDQICFQLNSIKSGSQKHSGPISCTSRCSKQIVTYPDYCSIPPRSMIPSSMTIILSCAFSINIHAI
jgi:hypothetical protein